MCDINLWDKNGNKMRNKENIKYLSSLSEDMGKAKRETQWTWCFSDSCFRSAPSLGRGLTV